MEVQVNSSKFNKIQQNSIKFTFGRIVVRTKLVLKLFRFISTVLEKCTTIHNNSGPQEFTNETDLSAEAESFDPDATLPYVLDLREDVYRVGWTGKVDAGTMSDDEEDLKNGEIGELWTHVYHADRPPAPYAESWKDEGSSSEDESFDNVAKPMVRGLPNQF